MEGKGEEISLRGWGEGEVQERSYEVANKARRTSENQNQQSNKQTNEQTNKQTEHTNRTNKQTEQTNKETNKQTNKQNKQTKVDTNHQTNKQTRRIKGMVGHVRSGGTTPPEHAQQIHTLQLYINGTSLEHAWRVTGLPCLLCRPSRSPGVSSPIDQAANASVSPHGFLGAVAGFARAPPWLWEPFPNIGHTHWKVQSLPAWRRRWRGRPLPGLGGDSVPFFSSFYISQTLATGFIAHLEPLLEPLHRDTGGPHRLNAGFEQ
jgi:hypothetical protein